MFHETFEGGGPEAVSTTYYYYNIDGNVRRVVTEKANPDPGEKQYESTWLVYATNGQAVAYVVGEKWNWTGGCPDDYEITFGREFQYDGARQRYLNRELNIHKPVDNWLIETVSTTWSDYDGDTIYGDYTVHYDRGTLTEKTSHEPGIARVDNPLEIPGNQVKRYYHADDLGTTRLTTGHSGSYVHESSTYTAFGVLVDGTNHRYGYVGKEGYQAHDEFAFLHVGARYYDPSTGRFLQRDPTGIRGGHNMYRYCSDAPMRYIDPIGLAAFDSFKEFVDDFKENVGTGAAMGGVAGFVIGGVAGGVTGSGLPGAGTLAGTGAGGVAGGAAGAIVGAACGGFYTLGELATPFWDWVYSDDFAEGAEAPSFGGGGRFGGRGGGASW